MIKLVSVLLFFPTLVYAKTPLEAGLQAAERGFYMGIIMAGLFLVWAVAYIIWKIISNGSKKNREALTSSRDTSQSYASNSEHHYAQQQTNLAKVDDGESARFWPSEPSSEPRPSTLPVFMVDEDRIYAGIAKELKEEVADKGLWTRLFAECDGDERRTRVLYIRQRANRLISAERLRLEQAAAETTKMRSSTPSDAQLMEAYGITFENERYIYGEYKYEKLTDAINYAQLQTQSRGSTLGIISGEGSADYEGAYERGDYVSALGTVRAAANQGYAAAQFFLGEMYTKGKGIPEDKVEAEKWYQQAAKQGCAKAQYRLGMIHLKGLEGRPNYEVAVKWLIFCDIDPTLLPRWKKVVSQLSGVPRASWLIGDVRKVIGSINVIDVLFYRGDSPGEGGSGIYVLGDSFLPYVLNKLPAEGGLIITDGSNSRGSNFDRMIRKNGMTKHGWSFQIHLEQPYVDKHRLYVIEVKPTSLAQPIIPLGTA